MKKITRWATALATVLFVSSIGLNTHAVEVPTLTPVWKSVTVPTAVDARQGVLKDGKWYIQNKATKTVEVWTQEGKSSTEFYESGTGANICTDDAGNIIVRIGVFPNSFSSFAAELRIIPADGSVPVDVFLTGIPAGRCDYFGHAQGNVLSSNGGKLYFTIGTAQVAVIHIANGVQSVNKTLFVPIAVTADASTIVYSFTTDEKEHVIVAKRGTDSYLDCIWNNDILVSTPLVTPKKHSINGCALFTMGGENYIVYPNSASAAYKDGFSIAGFSTDGNNTELINHPETLPAAPNIIQADWFGVEVVSDTQAKIYQYCPGGYFAMYEFEMPTPIEKADAGLSFEDATVVKIMGNVNFTNTLTKATDAALTFTSSNIAVATVDATGEVTILAEGETTIKVTSAKNAGYKTGEASYTLTVNPAVEPITPIFNYTIKTVTKIADEADFTNALEKNTDGVIVYESSVPAVATVNDEGLVHIVGVGTTTITAKVAATAVYTTATTSYELTVSPIPPIQVKTLWEKTAAAGSNYSWCTGSNQRDISYYNGVLYVQDKDAKLIRKVNATTGADDGTIATGSGGASVTVADDGTILYSLAFANTNKLGVAKWTNNQEIIMDGAEEMIGTPGRIDFFSAYGSIANGYFAAASINGSDAICVWPIKNGAIAEPLKPIIFKGKRGQFSASADIYPVSANSFWVSESTAAPKFFTMNEGRTDVTVQSFGDVAPTKTASGVAQFTYKRKTYVVCAESVNGSISVYDITAGISQAVLVTKTVDLGAVSDGGVKHCPIAVNPVADGVEIFVYATNNGIAAYKFMDTNAVELVAPTFEYANVTVTKTVTDEIFANPLNTNTNGKVTYGSSDKTVATIDDFGNVTILKAGIVTISATAAASEGYSAANASYQLTVSLVTPVIVFANEVETKTYGDVAFTNVLTNEAEVEATYSSSDHAVATVSAEGLVTILKGGTTTIKATTTATEIYKSVEATYVLTVNLATPTFEYVTVVVDKTEGDAKFTNTLTSTTDGVITYVSSDPTIATIAANGEVTVLKNGGTTITASAAASEKYAAATAAYTLNIAKAVGMNANDLEVIISKTANGIIVQFEGKASIEVYNINGMLLDKQEAINEYRIILNQGMYVVRVNGVSYKVIR